MNIEAYAIDTIHGAIAAASRAWMLYMWLSTPSSWLVWYRCQRNGLSRACDPSGRKLGRDVVGVISLNETHSGDYKIRIKRSIPNVVLAAAIIILPCRLQSQRGISLAYQLTHSANYDPSPSPDGEHLVYISSIMGREQLFTMNVDGTHPVQLTHDNVDHEDPAWSPDGRKIAFVYLRADTESIALMNSDGTGVELLTPKSVRTIHPNWSPDGNLLAWCTDDDLAPPRKNDSDIQVIDLRTRRIATLITGGVNTYPAWSPDGRRIAFRRMLGEMNSEVFIANSDGSGARNLTNHPAFDGWPSWSPDGTQIAFASNRNSNYQIFLMKADGSDVRLLANTEGRATGPQWGRDGKRVDFPICRKVDFGGDCEIFAVRTDGFAK